MQNMKQQLVIFKIIKVLVLIICCFVLFSCKKKNTGEYIDNTSVEIDTVHMELVTKFQTIKASGVVLASEEVQLAFKLGGKIKRIYVKEGDTVRKGELCAILDIKDVEIAKNQARLMLDKNIRDLSRVKSLYADSAATYEQFQNGQTAYDLAKEQYDIALEHEVQTQIIAPFDGVIVNKMFDEGEMVSPFTPLFVLQSKSDAGWKVTIGLSDKEVIKIKKHDKAIVKIDVFDDANFEGNISKIGLSPNVKSGLYPVDIKLNPTTKQIFSGFTATSFLYPSDSLLMARVPIGALAEGNNKEGIVFVIDKDNTSALRRKVKIKEITEGYIYITEGLMDGELIVSKGVSFLSDSVQVIIKNNKIAL